MSDGDASQPLMNDDDVGQWIGDDRANDSCCCRCFVGFLCAAVCIAPLACAGSWFAGVAHAKILCAAGIGVPIIACCILCFPISYEGEALESSGCCCGFKVNGAFFGVSNYFQRLATFAGAASSTGFGDDGTVAKFRVKLRKWFEDQTDGDPNIGTKFGGNTQMIYSWSECKQRLTSFGDRIAEQTLKRENELALVLLNNSMGKFGLGTNNKAHGVARPYLANLFDGGEGVGWTFEGLQTQFEEFFANLDILDHNLVSRNVFDVVAPSKSKTIVTQMVLKILHRIALDMDINDEEAKELAAMQTTDLLPMSCPLRCTKTFCMTACLTKPVRALESKWCAKYKDAIQAKFSNMAFHGGRPWNEPSLNVVASAFLDAMLQAGGRSVPLAIDLVMGYILSKNENKPPCLNGVDFSDTSNIKALLFEAMRYHPPVTTVPVWTRNTPGSKDWIHETICLDRALADPEVFPEPDVFDISRPNNEECSMAWADPALVNNDKAHPDSHSCPGQVLSINMVIAFVKAYQAAGDWAYDDNIKFNYYGTTKGFKCTK